MNESFCTPRRDRRNQLRVTLSALAWALCFAAVTLAIRKEWLPSWGILAGVIATSLLGIATVLVYLRFLRETDELQRKIEVEALALAFGVGLIGGLTYWLLVVIGAAPEAGFIYIFLVMLVTHPVGILIGRRRYS